MAHYFNGGHRNVWGSVVNIKWIPPTNNYIIAVDPQVPTTTLFTWNGIGGQKETNSYLPMLMPTV
jgi:hypothetical protein